jgi:hypothetical protein
MVGAEPSRFDYLFEPLDDGGVAGADGDVRSDDVVDAMPDRGLNRSWSLLALVITATVAGACIGAAILSWRPADAGQTPIDRTSTAPAPPLLTNTPTVEAPPPAPPPEVVSTAEQMRPAISSTLPAAPPALPPPLVSATPEPTKAPASTPIVRTPMSVSPEPRPAFPNQHPETGSSGHGGLLGLGGRL